MRRALVDLQTGVRDQLGGKQGGGADRDDLVVVAMEDQWRYRADQHGLGDTSRAVAPDIAGDFATTRGVADTDRIFQIQCFDA